MARNSILFYLLLVFLLSSLHGLCQWSSPSAITFDAGDTVYQHAIIIDTTSHHHNSWQIGRPNKTVFDSAYSWPNALVTDTLNPYPTNDTSVFILKLRNYYPTTSTEPWHAIAFVSFWHQLDIDTGSKGIVEYSTDTGHTWHVVLDNSWTPDSTTFTHSTHKWQNYTAHLPEFYFGDTLLMRFTFISDSDTTSNDGWIIDDFHIEYWTEGASSLTAHNAYTICPNPVSNLLAITAPIKIQSVAIRNTLGQMVRNEICNSPTAQVDVAELAGGVYFVYIDGVAAGKFLKE